MKNVNKVFLLGNVSRDPEIKTTASNKKVAVFGIATNRDWTTEGGDKSSITEFHNCIAWGRLADLCEMYLSKGQLVYGEGYLKTRSWEDEDGKRQFRTEVVLVEIIILEKFSKKEGEEANMHLTSDENVDVMGVDEEIKEERKEKGEKKKEKVDKETEKSEKTEEINNKDEEEPSDIDAPLFEEEK